MLRIAVVAIGQSRVSEWAGGCRCDARVLLLHCDVLIHQLRSCVFRNGLLVREEHSIMCLFSGFMSYEARRAGGP